MNTYWELYETFARVGVCTFGGGMAMLPILQREVVEKKGWATEEELTDYFAIGQCTPGIIAINVATFVGFRKKGRLGGVVATLGVASPSVLIIALAASVLTTLMDNPLVAHAMAGINICVVSLITSSVIKLGKKAIGDWIAAVFYLLVLAGAVLCKLSPVLLVLLAGLGGLAVRSLTSMSRKGQKP